MITNLLMALIASVSMEYNSVAGYLWYLYYRFRYFRLGEEMAIPAPLAKLMPYAKFAVALAGLVAAVAVAVLASPPAWVNVVIAAASALGVVLVPNRDVDAVLQDGITAVDAGKAAVSDVKAGNLPAAGNDLTQALQAVQDGAQAAEQVVKDLPKP